ncbi:hypothetical protein [Bacillus sp. FJAT-45037]|uniref:hypothetical protein n=1 Tax=Bacillus sp. FJAT-45037 TaxID=2011007 RepID=UPI000C23655B|nr:hypothetical protein [Bacillus sp. FJAT-45037]
MKQQLAILKSNFICFWRNYHKELPSLIKSLIMNRTLNLISIPIILSFFIGTLFLLTFSYFNAVEVPTNFSLMLLFFLLFYFVFRDIKKTIESIRYSTINGELFYVLPMYWRKIYSSKLLERNILPFFCIWLTLLAVIVASIVLANFSAMLLLNWGLFLSITIGLIFILKDIIALILTYVITALSIKLLGIDNWLKFIQKSFLYFFLPLVLLLFINHIFIDFEASSFITRIVDELGTYSLALDTPYKWLHDELINSGKGSIDILNYLRLYIAALLLFYIRKTLLLIFEKRNILPFTDKKQHVEEFPLINILLKLLKPFYNISFYAFFRKDVIYLFRNKILLEKFKTFYYLLLIVGGTTTSILIVYGTNQIIISILLKIFYFSNSLKSIIVFVFATLLSSTISSFPKQITSFDAEGKNIYWLKSVPMQLTELAKAKITLHYSFINTISIIAVLILSMIAKIPIIYVLTILISVIFVNVVFSFINVGSTIIFPRFEWSFIDEIGNSLNAKLFRLIEYFFLTLLIYSLFLVFIIIKNLNLNLEEAEMILILLLTIVVFTTIFSLALWKVIKNKSDILLKEK